MSDTNGGTRLRAVLNRGHYANLSLQGSACHSPLSLGPPEVQRAGLVCVLHLSVSLRLPVDLWSLNEWMWHKSASTQLTQDKRLMRSKDQEHDWSVGPQPSPGPWEQWGMDCKSGERESKQQLRSLSPDLELGFRILKTREHWLR